jgi:hypothetical protein
MADGAPRFVRRPQTPEDVIRWAIDPSDQRLLQFPD